MSHRATIRRLLDEARERSRKLPSDIHRRAQRKLEMLNAAQDVKDLKEPPGNRLEQLSGDREGQHSIRINDQWRINLQLGLITLRRSPEARRALEEMYGGRLRHVVLYGSHARGEARPEIDVDVLVILNHPFNLFAETKRLVRLPFDLFERLGHTFSIQPFTEQEYRGRQTPLMINVRKEGVML